MTEKTNKTKVLVKNMHLAYVNSELMYLVRKVFSIVNYVAWVKEQADRDFGFKIETKEDIQALQTRVDQHWDFEKLYPEVEGTIRHLLGLTKNGVPVDFAVSGGIKHDEDIELTIKASGDVIEVIVSDSSKYEGEDEVVETLARSDSYEKIMRVAVRLREELCEEEEEDEIQYHPEQERKVACMRLKKNCERCKALKMLSQEQPKCLLGHALHPDKVVPLEPCEKPLTYMAYITAMDMRKEEH